MLFGASTSSEPRKEWTKRALVPALAAVALTACNTTAQMDIPVEAKAFPRMITVKNAQPIGFAKIVSGIRYGATIAHFPGRGVKGASADLCNYSYSGEATLTWNAASRELGGWDSSAGSIFYDVMTQRGYDIATNPDKIFDVDDSLGRSRYLVGARIDEMRGNYCEEHHWWDGRPLGRYSGEMYLGVAWTVYDVHQRREIAEFKTKGYFLQRIPATNGIVESFLGAFAVATEDLAGQQDFIDIVTGKADERPVTAESPTPETPLFLPAVEVSAQPFNEISDRVIGSVVTVLVSGGHGSGFVVGRDGYILTNQHVVGTADTVRVRFPSGLEMRADVLRRHNRRDVALLKVPVDGLTPLPIKPGYPAIAAPIYVIGTPSMEVWESTVTRGIVSAIRKKGRSTRDDLPLIQADAAVHGGNSGGALIDEFGNVIGVTVAVGTIGDQATDSISLFIPIASALDFLNIKIVPATDTSGDISGGTS